MLKRLAAWSFLIGLATPVLAQEEAVQAPPADAGEKILVVGQRPGPGMWKVSKGDHVMWVFGSYSPLPIKMQWRSHEVESVLAQSQEFISPPFASPDIGKLRMLTLLPFAIGINKLPDDKTLRDVLPADLYQRWLPMKQKYFAENDSIERERPFIVADKLYWAAMKEEGLANGKEVREAINAIVKKHKIRVTQPEVKLAVDSPTKLIREFKRAEMEDSECFAKTLDRLDKDIPSLRVRANAWARGDIETIRKLTFTDREGACNSVLLNNPAVKSQPGFHLVEGRIRDAWLAAAEQALASNKSTFAVLPMKQILDPKGYLAALQAKGYTVEQPE